MARNPAQIGNHQQLHTLLLASNAPQFPEYSGKSQILSANVSRCFQSRGELESSVQWWQVCVHAAEVVRRTTTPEEAAIIGPLGQQQIVNLAEKPVTAGGALPGPAVLTPVPLNAARYSALKARIRFTDQTAIQRTIDVDIGGGCTLSFCGDHVGVDVLYPEPALIIAPAADAEQLEALVGKLPPGIVLDTWVQASAAPAPCAPIGRRAARYTVTRIVNPDDAATFLIEIPAGAVEATIYTTATDPATAVYSWVQSPTVASPVAVALVPTGAIAEPRPVPLPGTARWLSVVPALTQTVTVVYSLEY